MYKRQVQANADKRAAPCDVAKVCETYDRYQALNRECDEIREKRNANAKSMKGKMEPDVRAALVALDAASIVLDPSRVPGRVAPDRHACLSTNTHT